MYVDKAILEHGYCVSEFDMRPTQENFWEYVYLDGQDEFAVSGENYNIAALQFIRENGYQDDIANNQLYPNYFRYTDRFAGISGRLDALQDDPPSLAELKKEAGELAAEILKTDFPNIRKPNCLVTELEWRGLKQYCDKAAFEALVKEAKPHQIPSLVPKKTKGQTL